MVKKKNESACQELDIHHHTVNYPKGVGRGCSVPHLQASQVKTATGSQRASGDAASLCDVIIKGDKSSQGKHAKDK